MEPKGVNIDLAHDDITRPKWFERLRLADKWGTYIDTCRDRDVSPDWRTTNQFDYLTNQKGR